MAITGKCLGAYTSVASMLRWMISPFVVSSIFFNANGEAVWDIARIQQVPSFTPHIEGEQSGSNLYYSMKVGPHMYFAIADMFSTQLIEVWIVPSQ